jgi:restriction system protein
MPSRLLRIVPDRWLAWLNRSPVTRAGPCNPPVQLDAPPSPSWPAPLLRDDPAVPPWRSGRWSPEVLASMQERQFQTLCKALFAPAGAEVQALPREPEGVLDLRLYSQRERTPVTVVRCMHHPGTPVDVPELRDFLVEIASQRLQHGTFATSSSFTPEALDFASDSGFSALDGGSLLAMIERRTPQQQRALLAAACAATD